MIKLTHLDTLENVINKIHHSYTFHCLVCQIFIHRQSGKFERNVLITLFIVMPNVSEPSM